VNNSKDKYLIKHLQNASYRDKLSSVVLPSDDYRRLTMTYLVDPGGWREVIRIIENSSGGPAWFPDANIAILDQTEVVWDALRLAALGSRDGSTIFTGVVLGELQEWLDSPYHHEDRAAAIRNALASETWARRFVLEKDSPILPATLGYVQLLALRRFTALSTPDGLTVLDTDPKEKSETMNAIANKIGPRAQELAKKGRKDVEKIGAVNANDEMHCLIAICHSLITRRESVILTADSDFIEIFMKAQWFFDTHYRAYLAAKLIIAGNFGTPKKVQVYTQGYFDGPLTLYRRHTGDLREVLPRTHHLSVAVSIMYVGPDDMVHKIGFKFDVEMLQMLEMRSRTSGRCTDLFGDRNIHVDLAPLGLEGLYLGIGRDAGDWKEINGVKFFGSRLDAEHSINCQERHSTPRGV